ncbi:MlaA family lipoprotein [Paraburkholderia bonniea]|uniref:MlaA family lipoprotein n=1 Tax=Paraburkholderia bonniea TaxID=2152891 RepID=UPI001292789B|nr:VacJ family lipoprotein [Paraburkholderia bonniea]
MKLRPLVLAVLAASLVSGCASGPTRKPGDPLEPMNRAFFKFNDALDTAVAVPLAKGYQKVTPQPLRTAVSNFFSNLGDLSNAANNLLQLKITDAAEDVMRFAFNSTFGLGGLLDFATPAGLPKHRQDFGLTLGHWGVPSGPYLVLPVFGPSSLRDSMGLVVDVRFNPLNYAEPAVRYPLYVTQFVSVRSDLLGASELLNQAALDKYSFVRDAFTQQRRARLQGATTAPMPLPDYGDYGDPDDDTGAAGAANGLEPSAVTGAVVGSREGDAATTATTAGSAASVSATAIANSAASAIAPATANSAASAIVPDTANSAASSIAPDTANSAASSIAPDTANSAASSIAPDTTNSAASSTNKPAVAP